LEKMMQAFQQSHYRPGEYEVLGMDGKTVRGSIPVGETRGTHLLSIYAPQQGLTLAQTPVGSKENEIVAAPKVLQQVKLQGTIVMGDAMHTQREVSDQIVEAGGDYLWVAKENQPRTHWAIEKLFAHEVYNLQLGAPLSKDVLLVSKVQKNRGRIEKRTLMVSPLLNEYLNWPHVAQVFRLETTTWHSCYHNRTRKIVYGLTSLSPQQANPARLLALKRKYWGIESGLHFRRDVTLHEDATRLTVGASSHNMAILNNLVIALCYLQGFRNIAQARRLFCAQPNLALRAILSAHFPFL
jgi:predicted transposase YbfD/YdcC